MNFPEWEPHYLQIIGEFDYDREEDEAAALLLSRLLPAERTTPDQLRQIIEDRIVTVLGNGPGLAAELGAVEGVVVAADEAVSVASAHGIRPDVVVTDLDGEVEDILRAGESGSVVVIHAHGDNQDALRRWAAKFPPGTVATTQSTPFEGVHNFGGFTDGDRAVFLADHFGAREIRLLGFDFENPNEKDLAMEVKQRKLLWAKKLIEGLQRRSVILFPSFSN